MDKFGIFKLLTALNNSSTADGSGDNPLQSILNSLSQKPNTEKPSEQNQPVKEYVHLTSPLLDTIKNHDEFVKRVNKNKNR